MKTRWRCLGYEALTQANLLGAQDPTVEFETPNAFDSAGVFDVSRSRLLTANQSEELAVQLTTTAEANFEF